MAFDAARGASVLYGGSNDDVGSTWTYDGQTWTRASTVGPNIIDHSAMCFDSVRNVIVMHGGFGADDATWEWNGTAWNMVSSGGPLPLFDHGGRHVGMGWHDLEQPHRAGSVAAHRRWPGFRSREQSPDLVRRPLGRDVFQ
jgi:hypothetical protein